MTPPTALRVGAFVLLLLAAAPVSASGQVSTGGASISVRVLHNDSLPLSGATVTGGEIQLRTGADGRVTLRLQPGPRSLIASRIGFTPDTANIIVRAGNDTTVSITLSAIPTELTGVIVVTSTRSNRRIEDDPVRVEVLVREEIEEKLLMTPGDITMLLNETGGLRVQTTSPSLGGANVRVQGLRGRYTQILSDGLPLYGAQTGGLGLLQIPPMDLGAVEIVKGVSSALYGSTALGGVINLISRRPERTATREIMVNRSTLEGTDLVGFFSGSSRRGYTGYSLLAGAHTQGQLDRDGDAWTDMPGYERLVLRPRFFWDGDNGSAMFTVGFTSEDREGGTLPGQLAPDGEPFVEELKSRRYDAGGIGNFSMSATGALSLRASASVQNHRHRFGPTEERDEHMTWFSEASYSQTGLTSGWVLGLSLQQERYDSWFYPTFSYMYNVPGVFAQTTMELTPWLTTTASGRFDSHNEFGNFFSPRLSVLLKVTEGWSVRVSGGGGYFAPTPFTEETEVTGLSVLQPLENLRIERATSGSIDIGGSLGPVEVNATLFGSRVNNPIAVREFTSDPTRLEMINAVGPVQTNGAELLLRWHPGALHVTGSYTFVDSHETDPSTAARRTVPLTPRHQAGFVAAYEVEGSARVGFEAYYTGEQSLADDSYRNSGEPYVHLGILAEKRFGPVRVYINAENLLDNRQTKLNPLLRPSRGPGGRWTNDVWMPLEGKTANAGVRIELGVRS